MDDTLAELARRLEGWRARLSQLTPAELSQLQQLSARMDALAGRANQVYALARRRLSAWPSAEAWQRLCRTWRRAE